MNSILVIIFSNSEKFAKTIYFYYFFIFQDPYDQLHYDLVDSPTGLFDIDHSKGTVIALEGLDVGVYSLNISVHDGKFTSFGEAMVSVDLVNDEMLANAVIMRYVKFWLYSPLSNKRAGWNKRAGGEFFEL